jgi:hypothetical protein
MGEKLKRHSEDGNFRCVFAIGIGFRKESAKSNSKLNPIPISYFPLGGTKKGRTIKKPVPKAVTTISKTVTISHQPPGSRCR